MHTTTFKPARFCWLELHTPDAAKSKEFYTSLFGWTITDVPIPGGMVYSMLQMEGRDVGGMFQDTFSGAPPHWTSYVRVASVDVSTAKAVELGATVIMPAADVMEVGRMSMIQDPTQAIVALWQAKSHEGFGVINEPGSSSWSELNTHDPVAALAFYKALFGWSTMPGEDGNGMYTHLINDGDKQAGMMKIQPEWGDVPPHWLPYFHVTDVGDSTAKLKELGGQVYMGPMVIEGSGSCAVVADSLGVVFGLSDIEDH
ncbi:MAG: VOC family protein [Chthonomonadales bacterium]